MNRNRKLLIELLQYEADKLNRLEGQAHAQKVDTSSVINLQSNINDLCSILSLTPNEDLKPLHYKALDVIAKNKYVIYQLLIAKINNLTLRMEYSN